MNRTKLWLTLSLTLLIGLLVGCKSSDKTPSSSGADAAQINNAELQIGDPAPDFRLPDHNGGYVRLSDFEGKSNVIIAFYPAAFTPV